MKNSDLSVKILLQKYKTEIMYNSELETEYFIVVPLFGAVFAEPNKDTTV